ncbi:hypothetical protein HII36_47360 [Nonomuraea sp. NN258]|uniref:hypothetical protein n=1 Tax=Nonomuraea antri TaxID=2730852 RepID=UPI001567EFAC|nr:hypothetical protein [Nonomuraea antri]NRQ39394.1 hypothetical protein [Nonomuraea antri]
MTPVEHVEHVDLVERLRLPVLWRGYASAGRHLPRLVVPGVLVLAPLGLVSLLVLPVALGDEAALVDRRLELLWASDAALLTWTFVPVAVALVAQTLVFPATVLMAAGQLTGRPVPPVAALRAAFRRWPAVLALAVVALLVVALLVVAGLGFVAMPAAGAGLPRVTGSRGLATLLVAGVGLAAMPGLLAVPAVLLHGCSALGAIGRACRLSLVNPARVAFALAAGVVAVPAAAGWALERGLATLPDLTATPVAALAWPMFALAVTPFQAAVVARQFLSCVAWRTGVDDDDLRHGLPGNPSAEDPRPDGARLLTLALLPGLLFGGIVLVNPFRWPELRETDVTEHWTSVDGRSAHEPRLGPYDLRELYPGRGPGPVMVVDGFEDLASLLSCADAFCERTDFRWAEREGGYETAAASVATARLPDGRLIMTTWRSGSLELLVCESWGCAPAGEERIARTGASPRWIGTALAARRDGGVVVAIARHEPVDGDPEEDVVSFVRCPDPRCARPDVREVARLDPAAYLGSVRVLAVAVGPGDRPVAARFDSVSGQIQVISCQDAGCRLPARVTRPVPPLPRRPEHDRGAETGLALAVRPDGRPVIAYRDLADRTVELLDCATPDCARAQVITLGGGGPNHPTPALALDGSGAPLVAFFDRGQRRLMLARCAGGRCVSTAVARVRGGAGEGLAMTLDAEGRPVIAWIDDGGALLGGEWRLVVTTALAVPHIAP